MKQKTRSYSTYTKDATHLLGKLIQLGRKEHRMSAEDLADRVGISRGLLHRIEKGNLKCEIGVFFEAAVIVGVTLFEEDRKQMNMDIDITSHKLALLPKSIHKPQRKVKDDF